MKFAKTTNPDKLWCDGIRFDSIAEVEAYTGFKLLQHAGEISELQYKTKFNLIVNGIHICDYTSDFTYLDKQKNPHVIDVKGWRKSHKTGKLLPRMNREFHIKKNLMKACFGLEVEIV